MVEGLENLAKMEYPGRFIIIGQSSRPAENPQHAIVVYGITGRSPSSRARKIVPVYEGELFDVVPTDNELVKSGNPELLVYTAIKNFGGVAVSNGKQTKDVHGSGEISRHAIQVLVESLNWKWEYEPDAPNFTPRISGFVHENSAALSIIKRAEDGSNIRQYFGIPLIPGKGKLISTYTGININPLPSFIGEPLDVKFESTNPNNVAEDVWKVLKPEYRVSVACVFLHSRYEANAGKSAIINRDDIE